jgi:hypothetical protein
MDTLPPNLTGLSRRKSQYRAASLTKRDQIRRAAGATYEAIPTSGKKMARALDVDPSAITHRKQGRRASALSRFCEEAYKLERAGISAAYLVATVNAVAMWPELEKLSTPDLERLLAEELEAEQEANGHADREEVKHWRGKTDLEAMRRTHLEQAARSERIIAIADILTERQR